MSLEGGMMNNEVACNICSGQLISDYDTGEEICQNCGIVAKENIEILTPERRAFTMDEMNKRYRTGEPSSLMMYDMGLSSFIDNKNVDANGKQIHSYSEIERMRRLNKITVSNNSKTKNLNKAMREIRRITEILNISNPVAERAAYIYRKALEKGLIKGRSITGIVAATIYIACKDAGTPRSINELQEVIGNSDRKNIAYYFKFLLREMEMHVPLPVPSNSMSRIADKAKLSEKTVRKALDILSQVSDNALLSGKNPVSLAAASLYMASIETGEYTTQLRIAIAADVSTVTVRKRCIEILGLLKESGVKIAEKAMQQFENSKEEIMEKDGKNETAKEKVDHAKKAVERVTAFASSEPFSLNTSVKGLFLTRPAGV